MSFRELDNVALTRDLPDQDLRSGDIGVVVHVYGEEAVEVEFMRFSGDTQAVVTLAAKDIRTVRDGDIPSVRPQGSPRRP